MGVGTVMGSELDAGRYKRHFCGTVNACRQALLCLPFTGLFRQPTPLHRQGGELVERSFDVCVCAGTTDRGD